MPNLRSNILNSLAFTTLVLTGSLMFQSAYAADTSPQAQLQHWSTQAGAAGSSESGKIFFNQKHGKEWSCASCHGAAPVKTGTHANTGKSIPPLAPAANDKAFTDTAKINKWFRRNCKDVLSRECTATEKADVIAYLTAEGEQWRLLHVTSGYTMAGLLVFRIVYGLFGPRQASLKSLWNKVIEGEPFD